MDLEAYHNLGVTLARKEAAISQDQEANIDLNVLIFFKYSYTFEGFEDYFLT